MPVYPNNTGWQQCGEGTVPPTVNDDNTLGYSMGSRWFDSTANNEYVCLDASTGAAVWIKTTKVFGDNYEKYNDVSEKIETGTTYVQATRFTTQDLPAGDYYVSVWFEAKSGSSGKECAIRLQEDEVTLWEHLKIAPNGYNNFRMEFDRTLSGVTNFDIDIKRIDVNADAYIRNIRFKLWRIS